MADVHGVSGQCIGIGLVVPILVLIFFFWLGLDHDQGSRIVWQYILQSSCFLALVICSVSYSRAWKICALVRQYRKTSVNIPHRALLD
jgi:membrane-bound ClpP family serine protease